MIEFEYDNQLYAYEPDGFEVLAVFDQNGDIVENDQIYMYSEQHNKERIIAMAQP